MAQQQKILLYVFPLMFAVFGINFPVGVLIYWLTTNLWSMGQQFYVIRRNPTPGSQLRRLPGAAHGQGGRAAARPSRPAPSARAPRRRARTQPAPAVARATGEPVSSRQPAAVPAPRASAAAGEEPRHHAPPIPGRRSREVRRDPGPTLGATSP